MQGRDRRPQGRRPVPRVKLVEAALGGPGGGHLSQDIALALGGAAQAKDFPNWPSSLTCKPGDGSCARFEIFARGQISGTWKTLPPGARAICVTETAAVEKSYRQLQECLSNVMQESLKNQQRKEAGGEIVQLTPKAKPKTPPPPPPPPPAEPAPQAAPEPTPRQQ